MYRTKLVVVIAALAAFAAGCGGSDPERDQGLVDALASDLTGDADGFTTDQDEAACAAEGVYDGLGEDRMAELGITVDSPDPTDADLTEADANIVVDSLFECMDMLDSFARSIEGDDLTPEDADCVAKEVGEDRLRDLVLVGLTDPDGALGSDFIGIMTEVAATCEVPLN